MYVLRKLNSFCVQKKILRTFYTTFIESVLSFSFLCWYSSLSLRNKNRLQTLVRTCSKIIGVPLRSLAEFYKQQMLRKTRSITGDDSHPLKVFFEVLPYGRIFRSIKCSSNIYKFTFVPETIRFCNSKSCVFFLFFLFFIIIYIYIYFFFFLMNLFMKHVGLCFYLFFLVPSM